MVKCIVCGGRTKDVLHVGRMVPKCLVCQHMWIGIGKDELEAFHHVKKTWQYKNFEMRDSFIEQRKKLIFNGLKATPTSFLDIGCGDCSYLASMGSGRRLGLDIDDRIDVPEGVEIQMVRFDKFDTQERFNVVSSFHSLEHMVDCVAMFKKMISLANKRIAIEMPIGRRLTRHSGHAHSFSGKSFQKMVERVGGTKTICWEPNIQGKSLLWVGSKK